MSSLQLFQKPFGIKNYINTCVEFFNPPLPLKSIETGEEYLDISDLFQQSPRESEFEPFLFHRTTTLLYAILIQIILKLSLIPIK